jgi:ABC-type glucose/galactose transport system permease subunit
VSSCVAPAREPEPSSLPRTFVAVGSAEVFRDESVTSSFVAAVQPPAVVIGGTSLFGGRGVLIGTLIVRTLQFGPSQMGVDQQWQIPATGILIIVAVAADQ